LLEDVAVYYDTIMNPPDLDVYARRFVDKVNNEFAKAKMRSDSFSDASLNDVHASARKLQVIQKLKINKL
jgi:hypothetical protein